MFTSIRGKGPMATPGNAIAESSQPQWSESEDFMANRKSDTGIVDSSARVAHAFLRNQVLTVLAPVFLLRHRRAALDAVREIADEVPCAPSRAIDLHPTGIGRS